jgi:hypothetical protein
MSATASPARDTAASAAATNDRPAGNSRNSEVWLRNTRRGPATITRYPRHVPSWPATRALSLGTPAHLPPALRRTSYRFVRRGHSSRGQNSREAASFSGDGHPCRVAPCACSHNPEVAGPNPAPPPRSCRSGPDRPGSSGSVPTARFFGHERGTSQVRVEGEPGLERLKDLRELWGYLLVRSSRLPDPSSDRLRGRRPPVSPASSMGSGANFVIVVTVGNG